jgi:predicted nuclease of predicted toxin-antitoxin system
MKLLFDQNLSRKLVSALDNLYPDSQHVLACDMATAPDTNIWDYARINKFILVSKDSDFYYRSMLLSHPPKVIWLQVGNCATKQIVNMLEARHTDILAFEKDLNLAFIILRLKI